MRTLALFYLSHKIEAFTKEGLGKILYLRRVQICKLREIRYFLKLNVQRKRNQGFILRTYQSTDAMIINIC